ncbi:MAG: hypothetical protein LUD16_09740 [Lachnospiraceae bacterium]|nr:hypothetical protein [Lachnospiraceae bacterium]
MSYICLSRNFYSYYLLSFADFYRFLAAPGTVISFSVDCLIGPDTHIICFSLREAAQRLTYTRCPGYTCILSSPAILAIESFLYVVFLSLDLIGQYQASIGWKYVGILLCCFFSLSYQNKDKLVPAALTLTALADLFLLVLDQYYIFGLLLFFFVQMIYAVRLHQLKSPYFTVARILSPVFVCIILYAAGFINPINLLYNLPAYAAPRS